MRVLPLADPDPVLSPVMVSWLISGLTFFVTVIIVIVMVKGLRNKEKQPSELERETRTCKSPSSLFPPSTGLKETPLFNSLCPQVWTTLTSPCQSTNDRAQQER